VSNSVKSLRKTRKVSTKYKRFYQLDGRHDFQKAVPDGYVSYYVRPRPHAIVAYFNFDLAIEMGLLPKGHPRRVNKELEKAVIDVFGIQIINEFDLQDKSLEDFKDRSAHPYMATRYLQLQHPNKTGTTSGDGRVIWNGQLKHAGMTWDVSSCGTGATCLSPATAIQGRVFKTGDESISYGCGSAYYTDSLAGSIMSEILHLNGFKTERTLAILSYPNDLAIQVRAAPNLFRPSHFLHHLKQGNLDNLKKTVDFIYQRQSQNRNWPNSLKSKDRYEYFGDSFCNTFARLVARFENEYIFCWMDWDGDNILIEGGIIDYGSVRQFGLFHYSYRYDDDDRWSTRLTEQSSKARYLVQSIAQAMDALQTGQKKPIESFRKCDLLKRFDKRFEWWKKAFMLTRLGFHLKQAIELIEQKEQSVEKLCSAIRYFEKIRDSSGLRRTADGMNWPALFSVRKLFYKYPRILDQGFVYLEAKDLYSLMRCEGVSYTGFQLNSYRKARALDFQELVIELIEFLADYEHKPCRQILTQMMMRSSVINAPRLMTGDAVIRIAEEIEKQQKSKSFNSMQKVIDHLVNRFGYQDKGSKGSPLVKLNSEERKILELYEEIAEEYQEGI
jgi:uncharacterized protein YdiU (UPF0061 family)